MPDNYAEEMSNINKKHFQTQPCQSETQTVPVTERCSDQVTQRTRAGVQPIDHAALQHHTWRPAAEGSLTARPQRAQGQSRAPSGAGFLLPHQPWTPRTQSILAGGSLIPSPCSRTSRFLGKLPPLSNSAPLSAPQRAGNGWGGTCQTRGAPACKRPLPGGLPARRTECVFTCSHQVKCRGAGRGSPEAAPESPCPPALLLPLTSKFQQGTGGIFSPSEPQQLLVGLQVLISRGCPVCPVRSCTSVPPDQPDRVSPPVLRGTDVAAPCGSCQGGDTLAAGMAGVESFLYSRGWLTAEWHVGTDRLTNCPSLPGLMAVAGCGTSRAKTRTAVNEPG